MNLKAHLGCKCSLLLPIKFLIHHNSQCFSSGLLSVSSLSLYTLLGLP